MDDDRRELRGTPRVEALVLASITHYAAGDAVRAGIALETARDTAIETGYRFAQLAQLMHGAVRAGIRAATDPRRHRPRRHHAPDLSPTATNAAPPSTTTMTP